MGNWYTNIVAKNPRAKDLNLGDHICKLLGLRIDNSLRVKGNQWGHVARTQPLLPIPVTDTEDVTDKSKPYLFILNKTVIMRALGWGSLINIHFVYANRTYVLSTPQKSGRDLQVDATINATVRRLYGFDDEFNPEEKPKSTGHHILDMMQMAAFSARRMEAANIDKTIAKQLAQFTANSPSDLLLKGYQIVANDPPSFGGDKEEPTPPTNPTVGGGQDEDTNYNAPVPDVPQRQSRELVMASREKQVNQDKLPKSTTGGHMSNWHLLSKQSVGASETFGNHTDQVGEQSRVPDPDEQHLEYQLPHKALSLNIGDTVGYRYWELKIPSGGKFQKTPINRSWLDKPMIGVVTRKDEKAVYVKWNGSDKEAAIPLKDAYTLMTIKKKQSEVNDVVPNS